MAAKYERLKDAGLSTTGHPYQGHGKAVPRSVYDELRGFRLASIKRLDHTETKWLDTNGKLHVEKELSAEQLIANWKRQEKKGHHQR